ncbi:MAG: enoyl-CoA hydratase/isomerase family protein [Acidimicrobiales bacterium]|nr:enoyl-CoA hydratase/isomerase family protein [Acidimicrobiales bacterium]
MDDQPLLTETINAVHWLRLNRPDRLNAMTRAMAEGLRAQLATTAADDAIRVLVITGTGRAFSAGADKQETLQGPDATIHAKRHTPLWPVEELYAYPKPIIAALNGPAYGGGATLAMAADLRVAAASSSLTFNLVKVGLSPEFGSSFLLWRQVGYSTALEVMLTGRTVDASEAAALRLVNRVVPDERLAEVTQELAESLASLPAGAVQATKAVMRAGLESTFAEARKTELRTLAERARALLEERRA